MPLSKKSREKYRAMLRAMVRAWRCRHKSHTLILLASRIDMNVHTFLSKLRGKNGATFDGYEAAELTNETQQDHFVEWICTKTGHINVPAASFIDDDEVFEHNIKKNSAYATIAAGEFHASVFQALEDDVVDDDEHATIRQKGRKSIQKTLAVMHIKKKP